MMLCLPLCILTLLTIGLIKAMKARRRMQAEMQRQHCQPDSSMTFALVIVVIVFIICHAPRILWIVIRYLDSPSDVAGVLVLCIITKLHHKFTYIMYTYVIT